jgi:hypothetical protein
MPSDLVLEQWRRRQHADAQSRAGDALAKSREEAPAQNESGAQGACHHQVGVALYAAVEVGSFPEQIDQATLVGIHDGD